MELQATIPLNAKYTLDISKIDNIEINDTFKSVNTLRKQVIENYNESNPSGGTKKLIDTAISYFLSHERLTPSGYKIIITGKKQLQDIDFTALQQTQREKLIFKKHIDTLFQNYITTQNDVSHLTTTQLIKELNIFNTFYYEYTNTRYDPHHSTIQETKMLMDLLKSYGIEDLKDYTTDRMEKLQSFVYTSFSKKNIEDIAKNHGITATKLWRQGNDFIDTHFQAIWENKYIQPLIQKDIPPKYIVKRANKQYITDNRIRPQDHDYLYSIWEFTKSGILIEKQIPINKIESVRKQINQNFIEKLRRSSIDNAGSDYHKSNKDVLDYLIQNIAI